MLQSTSSLSRLAGGVILVFGCAAAHAAPSSSCPPVIGEKTMMLSSLQTLGTNRRMAQLCGVPAQAIQQRVQESIKAFKPCLDELGITQPEIDTKIKAGEPAGQEIIEKSSVKSIQCQKIREEY